jgi:hypothetical protein
VITEDFPEAMAALLEAKALIDREADRDDTRAKRLRITDAGIALALDASSGYRRPTPCSSAPHLHRDPASGNHCPAPPPDRVTSEPVISERAHASPARPRLTAPGPAGTGPAGSIAGIATVGAPTSGATTADATTADAAASAGRDRHTTAQ